LIVGNALVLWGRGSSGHDFLGVRKKVGIDKGKKSTLSGCPYIKFPDFNFRIGSIAESFMGIF
jgi:hypothetical protein